MAGGDFESLATDIDGYRVVIVRSSDNYTRTSYLLVHDGPSLCGSNMPAFDAPKLRKPVENDGNPHKAHLTRGAQWKREKGRRR